MYYVAGWHWWCQNTSLGQFWVGWVWGCGGGFLILHGLTYWWQTWYRDTTYLRSHIIGLDIHGVLNRHRTHFCALLRDHLDKDVDFEDIQKMPVHKCPHLDVTSSDEHAVFNLPQYWTEMPVNEEAQDALKKLRNAFR